MRFLLAVPLLLLALAGSVHAQFGFFEHMFGGGGAGGPQHQHQQQDVPSDARNYRHNYEHSPCSKYLCPDTLACVAFPHHCPCAWHEYQEKFELAEGQRICASKGGFKAGETARKLELARKGLL
ncbi:hypothetical protein VTK73DRAFT_3487 [Phialemonium thermophilum]|uniref:Long chronological lifespan protein 2 n=1 Tax=Phialemonium thermophilum TaxID=223376 RepID=A0ABR3VHR4_9PEZI